MSRRTGCRTGYRAPFARPGRADRERSVRASSRAGRSRACSRVAPRGPTACAHRVLPWCAPELRQGARLIFSRLGTAGVARAFVLVRPTQSRLRRGGVGGDAKAPRPASSDHRALTLDRPRGNGRHARRSTAGRGRALDGSRLRGMEPSRLHPNAFVSEACVLRRTSTNARVAPVVARRVKKCLAPWPNSGARALGNDGLGNDGRGSEGTRRERGDEARGERGSMAVASRALGPQDWTGRAVSLALCPGAIQLFS